MNITASDRNALVKLASSLPEGDETRKAILAGLKTASVNKSASVLRVRAQGIRDSIQDIVEGVEGEGVWGAGDYYELVIFLRLFLSALKNNVPDSENSKLMRDMTSLIRLLQSQAN